MKTARQYANEIIIQITNDHEGDTPHELFFQVSALIAPDATRVLKTLVDMYVANQGTDGEFITCITPPHASEMTKKQRKASKYWSAFDEAREIIFKSKIKRAKAS